MVNFVSVDDANTLISDDEVLFLDIRDKEAYYQSHIDGAQHLSDETMDQICTTLDRSKSIVVYCYHGISSVDAAEFLKTQGFQNVASLEGGYTLWKQKYGN